MCTRNQHSVLDQLYFKNELRKTDKIRGYQRQGGGGTKIGASQSKGTNFSNKISTRDVRGRRQWHPTPVLLLENPMDGGAWWATVHGVAKSQTRLSEFTFTFHFHALEKKMATHSSVLAWRIPGMGEPGGLPSMGSHSVRHD